MFTFTENEFYSSDPIGRSLQNLAEVCKEAYAAGLTPKEVQLVAGAAWADFLDPRESERYRTSC